MPELPEVERAAGFIKIHALGKSIRKVETKEDTIVFAGSSHTEFAKEITGRKVTNVARYGKVFYLELDGKGRMPVLHFGMTGNVLIKGEIPLYYKEGPKKGDSDWPPRFVKFILHLSPSTNKKESEDTADTQIAFVDARRLARVRLCAEPLKEPPISTLGFDPILCMPLLDDFSKKVVKRTCPIKALLLDQTFSAGVGNWIADEILYQSRIHPEQKCHTLTKEQVSELYRKIVYICQTAVSVNANSRKFPDDWLFKHRWGKGKKTEGRAIMRLPSGDPATIKWITVGGRTSAYVVELQCLNAKTATEVANQEEDEESELTALSDGDEESLVAVKTHSKKNRPQSSLEESHPKGRKRQKLSKT